MSNLISHIVEAGLRLGLSDKEGFVKTVSSLIEDYQKDPAKAEKLAQGFTEYLQGLTDDMRLQRIIEQSTKNKGGPGSEEFERLTKAIEKLTVELQDRKKI